MASRSESNSASKENTDKAKKGKKGSSAPSSGDGSKQSYRDVVHKAAGHVDIVESAAATGADLALAQDVERTVSAAQMQQLLAGLSHMEELRSQLAISQDLNKQQGLLLLREKQPPPYRALTLADLHPSRNPFSALLENDKNESGNSESASGDLVDMLEGLDDAAALRQQKIASRRREKDHQSTRSVVALANASVKINTNAVDSFLMRREATSVNTHRGPLPSLHNRLRDDLRMLTEKDPLTATENFFYHVGRILSKIPGVPDYLTAFSLLNPELLSDSEYLLEALLYRCSSQGTSGFGQVIDFLPRAGGETEAFLRVCSTFNFVKMYRSFAPVIQMMCLRRAQTTTRPDLDFHALSGCSATILDYGDILKITYSQRVWDFVAAEAAFQREFSAFVSSDDKGQRLLRPGATLDAGAVHGLHGGGAGFSSDDDNASLESARRSRRDGRQRRDENIRIIPGQGKAPDGIPNGFVFPDGTGLCFFYFRRGTCKFRDMTPRQCKLHHYKADNVKLQAALAAFVPKVPKVQQDSD